MAEKRKLKFGINTLISWGASVVIVGLMFKILHFQGGEWMIAIGLTVEALLFFVLGFQAEAKEPDWTRVYPELADGYQGELPKASTRSGASVGTTAALDKMLQDVQITPDLIGNLGTGLRSFGDKVAAISNVSDASLATTQFTDKLKVATSGFDKLNTAFEKASNDLANIGSASADAKTYQEQVGKLANNLQQLNTVYELELKESGTKLKSITQHYDSIAQTLKNFNESATDTHQLKEHVSHLNKNLASLNAIYGNMLAAMNQPRV
ncbi:type IX secretion system motor protein PorL/GldL [Parapedobacter koreensis]|uniref:Gliding motility-associated protein GldL n=1 Tax=Parapedobacter koreensis TaxID=332977 RepID=A0A1H7SRY7_9SPHI|nr:gliding motility protein GldL [Parapedobacter koreensis]SEL74826.1 gliding motility-associated protein GldL [Parapedobacter koreensis]